MNADSDPHPTPSGYSGFWQTFLSSKKYQVVALFLVVGILTLQYKLSKFISFGKRTLTNVYVVLAILNFLYQWSKSDASTKPDLFTLTPTLGGQRQSSHSKPKSAPSVVSGSGSGQKRNVTSLQKKIVAARQGWKCGICEKILDETYEVDHIVPLSQGGTNQLKNLMALDPNCHRKKTFEQQHLGQKY